MKSVPASMPRIHEDLLTLTDDLRYLYEDQPFTGIAYAEGADGRLLSEMSLRDGLQDGISRTWYSGTEKPCSEIHYAANNLHGLRQDWYRNGELKQAIRYEFGIEVESKKWNQFGELEESYTLGAGDPLYDIWQTLKAQQT